MHGLGSFTIYPIGILQCVCVTYVHTVDLTFVNLLLDFFHDKQGGQMEKSSCLNPLAHTCGVVSGNTQTLPSTVTVVLSWAI